MKMPFRPLLWFWFLCICFYTTSCVPSRQAIQTTSAQTQEAFNLAVAQTLTAFPTDTPQPSYTPKPTSTPPLPTETPTPTNTKIPTNTPAPKEYAFNQSGIEIISDLEMWTNARFQYTSEIGGLPTYQAYDVNTGLVIYISEYDGMVVGMFITFVNSPNIDSDKQARLFAQITSNYLPEPAWAWISNNLQKALYNAAPGYFETKTGAMYIGFIEDDKNNIIFFAIDENFYSGGLSAP